MRIIHADPGNAGPEFYMALEELTLPHVAERIGLDCRYIEMATVIGGELLVDEEGMRHDQPVNEEATVMRREFWAKQYPDRPDLAPFLNDVILGDALFMSDEELAEWETIAEKRYGG